MGEAFNKYFTRHFLSIEKQKKRYKRYKGIDVKDIDVT